MEQGYLQIGRLALALTAVLVAGDLLAEVSQAGGRYAVFFLVNLALIGLLCALVQGTRTLLRRRGVSRKKNIAATLTVDVVLTFALVGGITWGVLHFRWFTQESASYVYEGQEWDVHPENLPLTLEKMTGATYDHVRRDKIRQGSFLLGDISCWETAVREGEQFSLHYEIMEPKTAWLYRLLREDLTEQRLDGDDTLWSWRPADPAPWGAAAAYRRYRDDAPRDAWLLCWSDRIVSLHPEREPAAAEMARIGQALKS